MIFRCLPCIERQCRGCSRGPCGCDCRNQVSDGPHHERDHGRPRAVVAAEFERTPVARPTIQQKGISE